MALPEFSMRQLLEAGVHFGHQTARWNPRMAEFIYGDRNGIHIIDLTQTVPMLDQALTVIRDTVAKGGRVLFVGTKRQAQKAIAEAAEKSAQFYMNHRWLGGTLTNWKTVSQSINRLKAIDETMAGGAEGLTKKERLQLEREQAKLHAIVAQGHQLGRRQVVSQGVQQGRQLDAFLGRDLHDGRRRRRQSPTSIWRLAPSSSTAT